MKVEINYRYQNALKFVILGIPTWALVDGTWASLSQLADSVPEGYKISSYLVLSLTLGNLIPLLMGVSLRNYTASGIKHVITAILIIGMISGLLLSTVWKYTISVNGNQQISLPLCVCFFMVGACSSASNVTHFTFVSHYSAVNTSALATGMGLGSMTSGLLAIFQATWLKAYGFTLSDFYLTLSLLYVPSLYALFTLRGYGEDNVDVNSVKLTSALNRSPLVAVLAEDNNDHHSQDYMSDNSLLEDDALRNSSHPLDLLEKRESLLQRRSSDEYQERDFLYDHYPVLCIQFYNALLGYGLVPALVSVACSRFNNRRLVLLLATGITAVIDPLLKALTAFVRLETVRSLQQSALSLTVLLVGFLLCISLPGDLPLYDGAGGVLPVMLYVSFGALFGFSNTCVYRYFKANVPASCMRHSYRWGGMATQCGALVGSLIAFSLIVSGTIS